MLQKHLMQDKMDQESFNTLNKSWKIKLIEGFNYLFKFDQGKFKFSFSKNRNQINFNAIKISNPKYQINIF